MKVIDLDGGWQIMIEQDGTWIICAHWLEQHWVCDVYPRKWSKKKRKYMTCMRASTYTN